MRVARKDIALETLSDFVQFRLGATGRNPVHRSNLVVGIPFDMLVHKQRTVGLWQSFKGFAYDVPQFLMFCGF